MPQDGIERTAELSDDGRYRYVLGRRWKGGNGVVTFVMLNPSKADHIIDDPTITRCIGFARRWGHEGLDVVNLYSLRATQPAELGRAYDPVGPLTDQHLLHASEHSEKIICAWGASPFAVRRQPAVLKLLAARQLHCLDISKAGYPKHPLYLKGDLIPRSFPPVANQL